VKNEFRRFRDYLRSHHLKATKTRELIFLEIESSRHVHPNAREIYLKLRRRGRRVSLATVYRTLGLLVKSGMVSQIDLGEDHSHYEPKGRKSGHGHMICLSCGRVKEFTDRNIKRTIGEIGKEYGFDLDKFSIQVFGHCSECKKT
jgi:Fur family ferric uptake transcriptional regulator